MRRPASPRSAAEPLPAVACRVERIGADGDGVGFAAELGDAPLYIPLTLPGERVTAYPRQPRGDGWAAVADAVLEPSPDRVPPPCPHFGACGGCTLQHWDDAAYAAWKSAQVGAALRRAGFADAVPTAAVRTPPAARRRVDLALRRAASGVVVGLHRLRSDTVVDLRTCLVIHPVLRDLLAPLRALLAATRLLRREGAALVNLLDGGPDLLLRTDQPPDLADRDALIAFARANGLSRVCWALRNGAPEPICVLRPSVLSAAGVAVAPPPGAFLQASPQGEGGIVDAVLAGLGDLPKRAPVVELFAGCGTITFPLAGRARVLAYEGDAAAVAALREAANRAGLAGRVTATRRDLARQPLAAAELAGAAAVVLDPPYAGAAPQMAAIAAARPRRVLYVSCNPAVLGRDARVLRQAGYRLLAATPVDQFLWSARIESVCVFAL